MIYTSIKERFNQDHIRLADYTYMSRILKLKKSGLNELFQDPEMSISKISSMNKMHLIKLLLSNLDLNSYQLIDHLQNFDYSNKEYINIMDMLEKCNEKKIKVYTPFYNSTPKLFQKNQYIIDDVIFIKGNITDSDDISYSICGTREPTKDAILKTREIAKRFANTGFTLINGFAQGIDSEAFKSQIKNNGRYIGVLGSGLENIYPHENITYVNKIIENGALISQRFINDRVDQQSLQIRNKLSAELSIGSIFIEGTIKSGTKWQFKFSKNANKLNFYLEPKDWEHENSYICKMVKNNGGIQIDNDLGNIDEIIELFYSKYDN